MATFIVNSNSHGGKSAGTYVDDSNSYNVNSNSSTYSINSNSFNNKFEGAGRNKSIVGGETESTFPQYGINEIENIDTMELEYAYDILNGFKKQLIKHCKYNKWTEAFYRTILNGDFDGFHRRFKMIMLCLKKRNPQKYKNFNNHELASFVAKKIVDRFYNDGQKTTILMILLANSDKDTNCAQHGHGYCRIAHMIMKLLTKRDLAKLCAETAERSGKTAMHLAVSTGHSCQLRVLLALADVNPNLLDDSGRAPIHYAVERNNLAMVKMLMWYGADISMVQSGNCKYDSLYISLHANPSGTINHWLQDRLKSISSKMMKFASNLVKKCVQIQRELSTIHFIRVPQLKDNLPIQIDCQLNMHPIPKNSTNFTPPNSPSSHNSSKNRCYSVLFLIPIAFQSIDELSAAKDPKIVRTSIPDGCFMSGLPYLNYSEKNNSGTKLAHIFQPNHNGAFYAFKLPAALESLHSLSFSIRSSTSEIGNPQRSFIFAAQAFLCSEIDQNKSKMD